MVQDIESNVKTKLVRFLLYPPNIVMGIRVQHQGGSVWETLSHFNDMIIYSFKLLSFQLLLHQTDSLPLE